MDLASTYLIKGGWSAHGDVEVSGDTNSAIANTCLALLTGEKKIIINAPRTNIFLAFLKNLELLGVEIKWISISQISVDVDWNVFDPDFVQYLPDLVPTFSEIFINLVLAKKYSVKVPLKFRTHLPRYKRLGCIVEFSDDNYFLIQAPIHNNVALPKYHIHSFQKDFYALLNYSLLKYIYPKIHIDFDNKPHPLRIFSDQEYMKQDKYSVSANVSEVNFYAMLAVLTDGELNIKGVDLELSLGFLMDLDEIGATYEVKSKVLKIWQDLKFLKPKYNYISSNPDELGYLLLFHTLYGEKKISITCRDSFDIRDLIKTLNIMGCYISYEQLQDKILELTVKPSVLVSFKLPIPNGRWGGVVLAAAIAYIGNSIVTDIERISDYIPFLEETLENLDLKLIPRAS